LVVGREIFSSADKQGTPVKIRDGPAAVSERHTVASLFETIVAVRSF